MDDAIARRIDRLDSWEELDQFAKNAVAKDRLTPEVMAALDTRALQLGRVVVAQRTGLDLSRLSLAEERIVRAVSQYVAIKTSQGSHASRTFDQLRNLGLIGAAESAVCRGSPSEGFKTLADANQREISYERIVLDHPDEFSSRAIWYSRRALGLPNDSVNPPADEGGETQTRTNALILWLKSITKENGGIIPAFTNEEAATAIGVLEMQKQGRAHGNMQSRIDFACYRVGVPPLGLAAEKPFAQAWSQQNRSWAFPIASMQNASQSKEWSDADFDKVLRETEGLPGRARVIWKEAFAQEEDAIREWAFGFGSSHVEDGATIDKEPRRNARWSRDELILALDLYMQHRESPLAKDAPAIVELSQALNRLGDLLGQRNSNTYRNTNGVYMKLMNFRRLDPNYTIDGKKGLTRGNSDEARVWDQFAANPVRLAEVAHFIRNGLDGNYEAADISGPDEFGIEEAEEGKVATRFHRYRERDRRLVEEAKARALKKYGQLFCAACGFDFSERYGKVGDGIIDVHHTKPVHTMQPGEKTNVTDLVLLCSNCHRIVHSKRRWLTIDEVKATIEPRGVGR
jgi:predicted HNH restriction endonuclease